MLIDTTKNYLSFSYGNIYPGIAFIDIPFSSTTFYPAISMYYQGEEVQILSAEKQKQKEVNSSTNKWSEYNLEFDSKLSNYNYQIYNKTTVKSTYDCYKTAITNKPFQQGFKYKIQFQVISTSSPIFQVGITENDKDWKNQNILFTWYSKGYSLDENGEVRNFGERYKYFQRGIKANENVTMEVNTVDKYIKFSFGNQNPGIAFRNIPFDKFNFYPAVSVYFYPDKIKILKAESMKL